MIHPNSYHTVSSIADCEKQWNTKNPPSEIANSVEANKGSNIVVEISRLYIKKKKGMLHSVYRFKRNGSRA